MDKPTNIYQKIAQAKMNLVNTSIQKDGKNKSIGYAYFTSETVIPIVTKHCNEVGLLTLFALLKDEHGYYGELTIVNTDNPVETIKVVHRTDLPEANRGMNSTQRHGSCSSYSHRYLLQHTFGVVDNELEPDNDKLYDKSNQTSSYSPPKPQVSKPQNDKNCISESQRQDLKKIVDEKGIPIEKVKGLLNQYGIPSSHEIPKTKYNEIVAKLETLLKQ